MVMALEYNEALEILLKWSKQKNEVSFQLAWGNIYNENKSNMHLKAKMV